MFSLQHLYHNLGDTGLQPKLPSDSWVFQEPSCSTHRVTWPTTGSLVRCNGLFFSLFYLLIPPFLCSYL